MKVFLSWSGSASKQVALALRDWLPNVIQAVEPWMSSEDIDKGARWSSNVANELAVTKAGIVCVTPDNRDSAWLNFEAGALSKTVEKEMVCPYLFRLRPSDLTGPLIQFQASETTQEDTRKMVSTLNRATAKPLQDVKLEEGFDLWWPKLLQKLEDVSETQLAVSAQRAQDEILDEVLGLVRDQARTAQETFAIVQQMQYEEQYKSLYGSPSAVSNLAASGGMYIPSSSTIGKQLFPQIDYLRSLQHSVERPSPEESPRAERVSREKT